MNHDCNGDAFVRNGRAWMRCLLDSTILPMETAPEVCPNCGRKWRPVPAQLSAKELAEGGWGGAVEAQVDLPAMKFLLGVLRREASAGLVSPATAAALLACSDIEAMDAPVQAEDQR